MSPINREPLRNQIRRELAGQLIRGTIEPGQRLNENRLTENLGVSRTPLREALIQLEFEGILDSEPGKGFQVRPMSVRELEELLRVGSELEALALRITPRVEDERVEELRDLDERRREELASGDPDEDRLVELDDRWHRTLVGGCENETLHELLRIVRNRLYRYVYLIETSSSEVEKALREHDDIVDALEAGAVESAEETLRRHWTRTGQVMERFAEQHEA